MTSNDHKLGYPSIHSVPNCQLPLCLYPPALRDGIHQLRGLRDQNAHEAPRFHIDLEWSGMPVSIILKSYQINLNHVSKRISCLFSSPLFGKISGPNLTCDFSFAGPDTPPPLVPHMFLLGVDPADQPYAVKAFHVMTMNCFESWDYIQTKHILWHCMWIIA